MGNNTLFLPSKHPIPMISATKHASELSRLHSSLPLRDPIQNKKPITPTYNKENNPPDMKEIRCKGRKGVLKLAPKVHKSKVDLKFTHVGFKINIVLAV